MEEDNFLSSFLSFFFSFFLKKGCECIEKGEPFIGLPNPLIYEPYK